MIFSDETHVVIGKNRRVQECEKMDTALSWDLQWWNYSSPLCYVLGMQYVAIGTLSHVDGNINSRKYTEILDNNFWPVIAKFPQDRRYIFQEDNAPVHTSRESYRQKTENGIDTFDLYLWLVQYVLSAILWTLKENTMVLTS